MQRSQGDAAFGRVRFGDHSFKHILSGFALIATLAGLSACAPSAQEAQAEDEFDASGIGSMLNSESVGPQGLPHENAALALELLNSKGEVFAHCTSVLIRPNVILTTAHCFDAGLNRGLQAIRLQTTHDIGNVDSTSGETRWIVKQIVHPQYDSRARIIEGVRHPFYDHDIAIAILDRPLPSTIKPQEIARADQPLVAGMKVTAYGYGRSIDLGDSRGLPAAKRFKTRQRGQLIVSDKRIEDRNFTRVESKSRLCQGDSGGPAYLIVRGADPVVVGLNSGANGKLIEAISGIRKCDGEGVLQPVAPMRGWIDQVLAGEGL